MGFYLVTDELLQINYKIINYLPLHGANQISCSNTILDQFSSCIVYFRLWTSFLANFSGKYDLLMLCGDIESNPGPRPNSGQSFSICHWNLSSIAAHNFSKISL